MKFKVKKNAFDVRFCCFTDIFWMIGTTFDHVESITVIVVFQISDETPTNMFVGGNLLCWIRTLTLSDSRMFDGHR